MVRILFYFRRSSLSSLVHLPYSLTPITGRKLDLVYFYLISLNDIRRHVRDVWEGVFTSSDDLDFRIGTNGTGGYLTVLRGQSISVTGHFNPAANNTYDLGTPSTRWRNIYTNDLNLSNEDKDGGNDVDGTTGNWTIQEGHDELYVINNVTGKKYAMMLREVS